MVVISPEGFVQRLSRAIRSATVGSDRNPFVQCGDFPASQKRGYLKDVLEVVAKVR